MQPLMKASACQARRRRRLCKSHVAGRDLARHFASEPDELGADRLVMSAGPLATLQALAMFCRCAKSLSKVSQALLSPDFAERLQRPNTVRVVQRAAREPMHALFQVDWTRHWRGGG